MYSAQHFNSMSIVVIFVQNDNCKPYATVYSNYVIIKKLNRSLVALEWNHLRLADISSHDWMFDNYKPQGALDAHVFTATHRSMHVCLFSYYGTYFATGTTNNGIRDKSKSQIQARNYGKLVDEKHG